MKVDASVVMTVRHEPGERLERALESVAAQSGLPNGVELVVAVDPEDRVNRLDTRPRGAVRAVSVVANPGGSRSPGLNRAVQAASTDAICRLDARSVLGHDYVARCVATLSAHPEIGVVGGAQRPVPARAGRRAEGIARALSNPWALGGPAYRVAAVTGPVDTVYLGAFRRDELLALGGYDERLEANEDFDVCQRYRARGYAVWLDADLDVTYEARDTYRAVWRQYLAFGRSKVRYWRSTGNRPNARQVAALAAGGGFLAALSLAVRRRPRLSTVVAAGMAALAVVDATHPDGRAGVGVRVAAYPAYPAVVGGWLAGVAVEALTAGCAPVPGDGGSPASSGSCPATS